MITNGNSHWFQDSHQYAIDRQTEIAVNTMKSLKQLAPIYKVSVKDLITFGDDVESTILKTAEKEDTNLIILGASIKSGSDRLFFGSRIEYIIQNAKCPVLVLNT